MTIPIDYEYFVAEYFQKLSYTTDVTTDTGDYGVDVFAEKEGEKIAIQAKHYGTGTRKVNRAMIMELHGAKDYFNCQRAVLVTTGELQTDAKEVAERLNIEIIFLPFERVELSANNISDTTKEPDNAISPDTNDLSFQEIWNQYVIPMKGKTLSGETGLQNKIISVDNSGVVRRTSKGKSNEIPIEPFRWAFKRIKEVGQVTRDEINQEFAGRLSSGVVLILGNIPLFEVTTNPLTVKLKK